MGFNISGLVLDKNYQSAVEELGKVLGEHLVFEKEVNFEEASENWKEDDFCDVYFTPSGTLVFLSFERGGFDFTAPGQTAFSFVLSEMSMTFSVNYTENGELKRSLVETEGELVMSEGDPLEEEQGQADYSELIYTLFEKVLGQKIWDIEPGVTCYRYSFGKATTPETNPTTEKASEPEKNSTNSAVSSEKLNRPSAPKKPWWKFW